MVVRQKYESDRQLKESIRILQIPRSDEESRNRAARAIMEKYQPALEKVCQSFFPNREDRVKDILSETYLEMIHDIPSFHIRGNLNRSFSAWLMKIARNNCLDIKRNKKEQFHENMIPIHSLSPNLPDPKQVPPPKQMIMDEKTAALEEEIGSLSLEDKALIEQIRQGKSLKETGEELGLNPNTARMRKVRSFAKIKGGLKRRKVMDEK